MQYLRPVRSSVAVCVVTLSLLPAAAQEGGRVSELAEVRIPSVAIGRTYSTWHLSGTPVVVRNTSNDTVCIHLDAVIPARHDLRRGALPVPDRGWIHIEASDFVVPPHSEAQTDVRLTLPYDPDLAGHTYQVDLASSERRRGAPGWTVASGQRLLFSVEMDYRDDTEIDFALRRTLAPTTL